MDTAKRTESLSDLVKDLRDETRQLLRQEVRLARAETMQKVKLALRQTAWIALGGALLLVGLFEVVAFLNRATSAWLSDGLGWEAAVWVAPLAFAIIFLTVGAVLVMKALNTLKEDTVPEHTMHSIQETKRWARHKKAERRTA